MSDPGEYTRETGSTLWRREEILAGMASGKIAPDEAARLLDAAEARRVSDNATARVERTTEQFNQIAWRALRSLDHPSRRDARAAFRAAFGLPESATSRYELGPRVENRTSGQTSQIQRAGETRRRRRRGRHMSGRPSKSNSRARETTAPGADPSPGPTFNEEVSVSERDSIIRALDKAGEPSGLRLLAAKTGIPEGRLLKILPQLVARGVLRQRHTGQGLRYTNRNS